MHIASNAGQYNSGAISTYISIINACVRAVSLAGTPNTSKSGLEIMSDQMLLRISIAYNQCQVYTEEGEGGGGMGAMCWHWLRLLHNSLIIRVLLLPRLNHCCGYAGVCRTCEWTTGNRG